MSYRRPSTLAPGSSGWRVRHRTQLILLGIPAAIADSDRALSYVLLHGDDELGTGWRSDDLTPTYAARLLEFLGREFVNPVGYGLIANLRRRLQRDGLDRPPRG